MGILKKLLKASSLETSFPIYEQNQKITDWRLANLKGYLLDPGWIPFLIKFNVCGGNSGKPCIWAALSALQVAGTS
ncbi:hypothetical protein ACG2E4_11635 [Halalkalibaculum sp. DA384]